MTRGKLLVAVSVAAWALGTTPAWAQRERGDAPTTGSSVDRGSAGSSSSGSGGGASTSSGGGSSASSSTGSGSSGGYTAEAVSAPSNAGVGRYVSAPVRPNRGDDGAAQGRSSSDGGGRRPSSDGGERSGSRAVPRGSDTGGAPSSASRTANASNGDSDSPSRRAVPTYSRPRDGRPITGTAVDWPAGYYGGGGGGGNSIYYPYYPPTRPTITTRDTRSGSASTISVVRPVLLRRVLPRRGSGGYPGGGYSGGGYQGGGTGTSSYGGGPTGSLRLKIKPRDGKVYIDGYFVGVIDDFDGMFQKLADRRRRPSGRDQGDGARADLVRRPDHSG